jgi:hypothetical protein
MTILEIYMALMKGSPVWLLMLYYFPMTIVSYNAVAIGTTIATVPCRQYHRGGWIMTVFPTSHAHGQVRRGTPPPKVHEIIKQL